MCDWFYATEGSSNLYFFGWREHTKTANKNIGKIEAIHTILLKEESKIKVDSNSQMHRS